MMKKVLILTMALMVMSMIGCAPKEETEKESNSMEPTMRMIKSNGLDMRIAEMGEGPLVIFVHGWPESWYSWRHQLPALAAAGYHAVAPDMRGYGKTDAPENVEDYDIEKLTADVVGVIDALGEETAIVVGHDWGSIVAWNCTLLHPDRFSALIAMSVPYGGRAKESPIDSWKRQYQDNFFYILYYQDYGAAEKEFDADPRGILSRLYLSPDSPREAPTLTDPKMAAGGWIPRLGAPKGLPDWLSQEELDYYVDEFTEAGFRGGINYYRNFERNWEITPQLDGVKVKQPVLFVAGEKDVVIGGANAEALTGLMSRSTEDLRDVVLFPEIGHWVQQEAAEETNAAILTFLEGLK
jgi:pimeloyl-ACP methyl ester carboxylesterase